MARSRPLLILVLKAAIALIAAPILLAGVGAGVLLLVQFPLVVETQGWLRAGIALLGLFVGLPTVAYLVVMSIRDLEYLFGRFPGDKFE